MKNREIMEIRDSEKSDTRNTWYILNNISYREMRGEGGKIKG